MKCKIFVLVFAIILLSNIHIISAALYYNVSINYNKGVVKINSFDVIFSNMNLVDDYGDFSIEQKDKNNQNLIENTFSVPNVIAVDNGDINGSITGGEVITLDEVNFNIFIPYNENTRELAIYDKEKKEVTKANVGLFSKESINDNTIDEKEIKKELGSNYKTKKSAYEMIGDYWWIAVLVILVIIVVLFRNPVTKK